MIALVLLLDVGQLVGDASRLRHLKTSDLDGLGPDTLRRAARHLRAASHHALVAARRLEHRADLLTKDPAP